MTRKTRPAALLLGVLAALMILAAGGGCTKNDPIIVPPPKILPQTSEANVLENLKTAWQNKRIDWYCVLLADDYQFYFDENTRLEHGLPIFWTRLDDSLGVAGLFASPYTRSITVTHTGMALPPVPVQQVGRENWTRVDVRNSYLEVVVEANPEQPEGMTYKVNSSLQYFFFRKGRTPTDTDTTNSPTAKLYYIVEWDDTGQGAGE